MENQSPIIVSSGSLKIERMVQFRVKEGSDLLLAIKEAIKKENIGTGVVVSGIGALNKAIFRNLKRFPTQFPVQRNDRIYLEITAPMELVSLGGWIAKTGSGEQQIHIHFSASTVKDETVITLGGHLIEGTIAGIKVVIGIAVLEDGKAFAKFDENTKSLDIMFD